MSNRLDELPSDQQSHWLDYIAHCALGEQECMSETGADQDEIEEFMLNNDYERCPACQWFEETFKFIDDDGAVHEECEDCREDK
ncbi:hypothetical protein [Marinobacterium stanieri]|uniref:hypothetical protein n=1 Tax=Marinobacterium stanieri TaxID=49186 RepID=UPI000255A355|nr:hypothetical protein [Marinobacterium stanieri]